MCQSYERQRDKNLEEIGDPHTLGGTCSSTVRCTIVNRWGGHNRTLDIWSNHHMVEGSVVKKNI